MSYSLEPEAKLNETLLNSSREDRRKAREYLYTLQQGCCAICGSADSSLGLDHDHYTDRIRGLLCNNCNALLGMAGDNALVLKRAINYLDSGGLL